MKTRRPNFRSPSPELDQHMSLQEFPDEICGRFLANLGRRADLLNSPPVHYHDAIRDRQRLILIMGYEQGRGLELALELFYPCAQLFPDHGIQSSERLIKKENPGLYGQRPGKSHPLPLAPGQFGRKPVLETPKLHQSKQFAYARANQGRFWSESPREHFQAKRDILENIHMPEQSVMLEYETDSPFQDWEAGSFLVVEKDTSKVWIIEAGNDS